MYEHQFVMVTMVVLYQLNTPFSQCTFSFARQFIEEKLPGKEKVHCRAGGEVVCIMACTI